MLSVKSKKSIQALRQHRSILISLFLLFLVTTDLALAIDQQATHRVTFVDIAAELGVDLQNITGDSEQTYIVDTMMGGSAFLDYDQDGDLDLYILNGSKVVGFAEGNYPRNAFYRNDGTAFTDITQATGLGDTGWGMGCTVADYDNDGDPDIYITNYGKNVLYNNQGDGTFKDVTDYAAVGDDGFGTGCTFFDYNSDGYLDLYVANYVDFKHFIVPRIP